MAEQPKTTVSARIDPTRVEHLEGLAKVRGVTRSVLVEQLIVEALSGCFSSYNGPDGSVNLRLLGEINSRGMSRPRDAEHPGVELWEVQENVWPRHFVRVFAEYDEDGGGSSECWYLWRGSELEKIDPAAWVKQRKRG